MNLADQLHQDMVAALKGRQDLRLSTLRMALAAIKYKAIERRTALDDAAIQQVLATLIKQREDSAEQFAAGGRPELAEKERREISILNEYLPRLASTAEIEAAVQAAIAATGAQSAKDLGAVMKAVMAQFAAAGQRADGKQVNAAVRRGLGAERT